MYDVMFNENNRVLQIIYTHHLENEGELLKVCNNIVRIYVLVATTPTFRSDLLFVYAPVFHLWQIACFHFNHTYVYI